MRYPAVMAPDATLIRLGALTQAAIMATRELYRDIRAAKANGYSYNELELATGLPRGTLQNIVAGRNPRITVEDQN